MSRRDEPALWRLFDAIVRAEYERALTLAKQQIGPLPTAPGGRPALPLIDGGWRLAPAIKARLAGGYCLRAEAKGASPYANICEHCPGFRADPQPPGRPRRPARRRPGPAADADARGWSTGADRHRRLAERLDALIAQAQAG